MTQYFAKIEDNIVVEIACVTKLFMDENPDRYPGEWVECFQDCENPAASSTYAVVNGSYNRSTKTFGWWQPAVTPVIDTPLEDTTSNLRSE